MTTLAFFYELSLGPAVQAFVFTWGTVPAQLRWATLFTSVFLHGGWMHFLGNMWFLWIFGDNVEDHLGHGRYLLFYLIVGAAAGYAHVWLHPLSEAPTIGASGAISGVMGAYLVLHPWARIRTLFTLGFFFRVVHVPALFFLGLWFVLQLAGNALSGMESGVAFGAHLGGFVVGAAFMALFRRY